MFRICFRILFSLQINEPMFPKNIDKKNRKYDWKLILQCVLPTLVIVYWMGLTIPFINLFFFHSFNIDSAEFTYWWYYKFFSCFFRR